MKIKDFCDILSIDKESLGKEAIKTLKNKNIYFPELIAYIQTEYGYNPSFYKVNNFLCSNDVKFHFGIDVKGWKKITFMDYLKSKDETLAFRYENIDEEEDCYIADTVHNMIDSLKSENCIVNQVLEYIYIKQ